MKVYGMGERKTPAPFIVACDKFVYIEVIRAAGEQERAREAEAAREETQPPAVPAKAKRTGKKKGAEAVPPPAPEAAVPIQPDQRVPPEVVNLIADSLDILADEDGYTFMGELGNLLVKKQPDFDPRNFGFSKLTPFLESLDMFEIKDMKKDSSSPQRYVRLK